MVYHTHCFWRKNSLHRKWCVGVSSCSWIHRCFPGGSDDKASVCNTGDLGSTPGLGRRKWQPTPVFLPGKSHGQWSLVGYLPRGRKELDMTERDLLPFYSGPEAAGLIKQWNGLLRTEDQCPLVTIYCRVGAMFLGGCISSQSSSIIRHQYSQSPDHKVQGIKTEMAIIKKAINNKCWRGCGERESCCIVGGKVPWYSHNGDSLKKLGIKLPNEQEIPLLVIYFEETKVEKDTWPQCSP